MIGLILALSALLAPAQVEVTTRVHRGAEATADFAFKDVPAPSTTDAANRARFRVLRGRADGNGAGSACLNDGLLPADGDAPGSNFFFAPGTDGGRLLVDLGRPVEIREITSYSWHGGPRGPQVYRLYAAPAKVTVAEGETPDTDGWRLVADVDSRVKDAAPGGQVGVSIRDASGKPLGTHRYLLFDIRRTGRDANFDNTFFSEIDVHDGRKHDPPAGLETLEIDGGYRVVFDTTQLPGIREWVDKTLKPVCAEWYPKIVKLLPGEGYAAPRRFTIAFRSGMKGVAHTVGTRITCAGPWFMKNLEGEAAGAVVHEMVHVVQQYGRREGGSPNPGWLVEGVADYVRWFLYEPAKSRPRPDPRRAKYTDSYRTTAAFLDYLVRKHDPKVVEILNAAMREGGYREEVWKERCGKPPAALWEEYAATLR